MSVGSALLAGSFWSLAHLRADTSLSMVSLIVFVGGLGSGLALMSPNIVALNSVQTKVVSQASALSSVTRQLGAAVGIAILAAVYATIRPPGAPGTVAPEDAVGSYNDVFLLAFGIMVVVLLLAQRLPGKAVARQLQQDRRADTEAALLAASEV